MMTQVQCLSPLWLFEPFMLWMNSNPKAYDWTLLEMEAQFVSWMSLSPTLKPIKGVLAWSTSKAKSSQDACFPSASPSHFIIIEIQAHQVSSILNGSRRSKWSNFASLHIWFATSWLNLKFVSLFHVSMFLWILKIHVAFDVLCSCIYFKKKIQKTNSKKKKFQDFQIFPKKR